MGNEDEGKTPLPKQLERRDGSAYARVVGNTAILERNVEVDPDKRALALRLDFLNGSREGLGGHIDGSVRRWRDWGVARQGRREPEQQRCSGD